MLLATGKLPLSAEGIADHHGVHPALPPETGNTVEFGRHLVQVCTGCHRKDLSGGPIAVGPPDWPAAGNLTPDGEGLQGWTYAQFATVMRTGERPDGSRVKAPMDLMMPYAQEMTEVEMQALWTYLQSVDGKPTGT
jgi:cytochrome c553